MSDCQHGELEFAARAIEVTDGRPYTAMLAHVRCSTCQLEFHFRGVGSGVVNPDEPVTSADGYELRIPIAPGPGAVVELMQRAGLTRHLVDPNQHGRPNGE